MLSRSGPGLSRSPGPAAAHDGSEESGPPAAVSSHVDPLNPEL